MRYRIYSENLFSRMRDRRLIYWSKILKGTLTVHAIQFEFNIESLSQIVYEISNLQRKSIFRACATGNWSIEAKNIFQKGQKISLGLNIKSLGHSILEFTIKDDGQPDNQTDRQTSQTYLPLTDRFGPKKRR